MMAGLEAHPCYHVGNHSIHLLTTPSITRISFKLYYPDETSKYTRTAQKWLTLFGAGDRPKKVSHFWPIRVHIHTYPRIVPQEKKK